MNDDLQPNPFEYEPAEIAEGAPSDPEIDEGVAHHRKQARFAYLLARSHVGRLLHVHGIGWHYWDGARWAYDDRGQAMRAVIEVVRRAWVTNPGDKDVAADVLACQSAAAMRGVLDIAAALRPFVATVADLDADPYLLNVANGTLDLRTFELHRHDPADKITKVARAAYDPDADPGEWETFLARVLPDPAVRAYLARFAGVALLGVVREQIFTIATGSGANGKSKFDESLVHALGDYAHVAESDLFMTTKSNANAASPAKFALRGTRFVVTSETERDQRLATALMKMLTGGDPITARALHRDPVTFEPSHTVLMVTNHLPKVAGDDPAVWRRMRVVPFDVVIPEAERDPRLGDRLKLAADAVLAWAVAGYRDYLERGMGEPPAVLAATDSYQKRSDAIARFIEERCITGPHFSVRASELYAAWVEWATDDGAEPMAKNVFSEELDKRGFPARRAHGGARMRRGIGLQEDGENDA